VVFSPAPDGKYFCQHPAWQFAIGNYWTDMDTIIGSHVFDEGELFVNHSIKTDQDFNAWLNYIWPAYTAQYDIIPDIEAKYPSAAFKTEADRYKAMVAQSSIICNIQQLGVAYAGQVYNVQFSALKGTHGSDILPTWYNPYALTNISGIELPLWGTELFEGLLIPGVARGYQSYLVNHARTGNPNSNESINIPPTIQWPFAGIQPGNYPEYITDVLNVTDTGFEIIEDTTYNSSICGFWTIAIGLTTAAGPYDCPPRIANGQGWRR